ncbi:MAG TPA: response regulator [Opitutaceae bacterium]|nr:response regulator [Opitutaceae bacterium]
MATVLVVEDDKLSQRILSKMLSGAGHTALLASSVSEAWTSLRQNVWADLVILDNQLGHDWGWQFLESLRDDVLYRDLPVVVYTGHTERSSILRYVELGVKSMLVKPYKAEIVFEEVAKAVKADWAASLLEDSKAACARLQIKEADYFSVLSAGATVLENVAAELRRLVTTRPDETKIRALIQQLLSQSIALGMPALKTVTEALVKGIGARNSKLIQNCLQSIDALRTLLRNRALAHVGIENVVTPAGTPRRERPRLPQTPTATTAKKFFIQRTAAAPFWSFGSAFGRIAKSPFLNHADHEQLINEAKTKPAFGEFQNAIRFLCQGAQNASLEQLEADVKNDADFQRTFLELVERLSGRAATEESEAGAEPDVSLAINRLGIHKTIILIAARRLGGKLPSSTVLDLEFLRVHTLASMILSQEIGRMLRLDDDLQVGAAGAAHSIGSWLYALEEPGLYAIALARAEISAESVSHAEEELLGQSHAKIGRALLELGHFPEAVRSATEFYENPGELPPGHARPTATAVHLAHELAWAVLAGDDAPIPQQLSRRVFTPTDLVWTLLQQDNVQLPMDIPEFIEALSTAATNAVRTAHSLTAVVKN